MKPQPLSDSHNRKMKIKITCHACKIEQQTIVTQSVEKLNFVRLSNENVEPHIVLAARTILYSCGLDRIR